MVGNERGALRARDVPNPDYQPAVAPALLFLNSGAGWNQSLVLNNGTNLLCGPSIIAPWFVGNGSKLTYSTNSTAPANGSTVAAWLNVTLTNGAVLKLPLYQ